MRKTLRERHYGRLLQLISRQPLRRRFPWESTDTKGNSSDTVETDSDGGSGRRNGGTVGVLAEQASDLMFVGLAEAEGFAT